jgi:hypothetical protein
MIRVSTSNVTTLINNFMVKIFTVESFSTTSKKIAQDFNINLNFRNKIYAPNFSKH